jgi:uncharacterized protein YndB with AHSA1/START domain
MAELTVTHHIAATPERVFDAWLDPATARRFLFATPTGEMIRAEVDARVGGRFTFVDRRPDMGDVLHTGEYLEINRPRRLVFTFAVPQLDPAATTVALTFEPEDGGCLVTLHHTGVLEEWAAPTTQGWAMILEGLAGVIS